MRNPSASPGTDDGEQPRPNVLKRVETHIQSKTLSGLADLAPALITLIIALFLVEKFDALIRPLPFVAGEPWDFPGIGLIVGVAVFYFVGLLISTRFGLVLSDWKNRLIGYIPVVKNIFGVTRQVMTSFTSQYTFSRVVFLEWPREGMIAMGFVTGRAYSAKTGDSMAIVYIPTIPNPTSGNMALVMEDDLLETDLDVDDAMKLVFSGGIVLPDALSFARVPRDKPEYFELIGRFESEPVSAHEFPASESEKRE